MALTKQQITVMTQHEKDYALFEAAKDGHLEEIRILIKHGADPIKNFVNGYLIPYNTLGIASKYGHREVIQELLKNKDVKNNATFGSNCALFWAARNGYTEVVKALLEIKNVKDNAHVEGNRALSWAVANGRYAAVDLLLGLDVVKKSLTPDITKSLEEKGFYAWQAKHSIISAIRGMKEGRLPIEITLPIMQEVYPEFSENVLSKQINFVEKLLEEKALLMFSKLSIKNHSEQAKAETQLPVYVHELAVRRLKGCS